MSNAEIIQKVLNNKLKKAHDWAKEFYSGEYKIKIDGLSVQVKVREEIKKTF